MRISELTAGLKNISIGGIVSYIGQPREVTLKSGETETVTSITLQDDSGSISVNIWCSLVDNIKLNSEIRIEKGYVNEFRDNLQFNLGYYGKIFLLLESNQSKQ